MNKEELPIIKRMRMLEITLEHLTISLSRIEKKVDDHVAQTEDIAHRY